MEAYVGNRYTSVPKRIVNFNSWLVSIMISANIIGIAINRQLHIENPLVIIIISCFILSIIVNKKIPSITTILICYYFIFFYAMSYIFADNLYLRDYFISFIFYAIPSFYIVKQPFETDRMLRNMTIIYTILLPMYLLIDFQLVDPGGKMGYGYSIVPGIMAAIYCLGNKDNRLKKRFLFLLLLLAYLYISLVFSSRGIYLTIIVFSTLLFITRNSNVKNIMYGIITLVLTMYAYIEYKTIISIIGNIGRALSINAINHSIILLEANDFSNGRALLYDIAVKQIYDKVIFGYGIGAFQSDNGIYEHNFILQLLHEGGILFTLPIITIITFGIIAIFNRHVDNGYRYLLAFLFSLSIIKLMVSSVFWKEPVFWMYLLLSLELVFPPRKIV